MPIYFLDSSAFVKRYVSESGSRWISSLVQPTLGNEVYIANITGVEVVAALARRAKTLQSGRALILKSMTEFQSDFSSLFRIVGLLPSLILSAMEIAEHHALRGYGSVQLAAARKINQKYLAFGSHGTLVSANLELNAAAVTEGLVVENPNDHP